MRSPILEGERPNAPGTWQKTNVTQQNAWDLGLAPRTTNMISYDLTWHHNIPWSLLRDSWNIVYTFCSPAVIGDLFDLYAAGNPTRIRLHTLKAKLLYIREAIGPSASNGSSGTYEKWMARVADGAESHLVHLAEENQLSVDEWDALYSIVAWQSWNIVEGPKESVRTDDPGSTGFDDFRGADPGNTVRFNLVNSLFTTLDGLVKGFPAVKGGFCDIGGVVSGWNDTLGNALAGAAGLKHANRLMFDVSLWKVVAVHRGQVTANLSGKHVYWIAKKP